MDDVQAAAVQWQKASYALDGVCQALAAVPGTGDQYEALCRLTAEYQRAAGRIMDAAVANRRLVA